MAKRPATSNHRRSGRSSADNNSKQVEGGRDVDVDPMGDDFENPLRAATARGRGSDMTTDRDRVLLAASEGNLTQSKNGNATSGPEGEDDEETRSELAKGSMYIGMSNADAAVASKVNVGDLTRGTAPDDVTLESKNLTHSNLGRGFRSNPFGFMLRLAGEGSAFYSGTGWRAFDHYIGQKLFYPEYTVGVRDALRSSVQVQGEISKLSIMKFRQYYSNLTPRQKRKLKLEVGSSDKKNDQNLIVQNKNANRHYDTMIKKFKTEYEKSFEKMMNAMIAEFDSKMKIKVMAFFTNTLLTRCYNQGIHIRESEYIMLRKYALYAEKHKLGLIFLPCHKSHIDYLVMSMLISRLGIALPHIAAGENLNMPVVGYILKHSGAFFIRRVWGDDTLYGTLMHEYVELILNKGYNMEIFVEGTRSRVGKVLQPKFGFIKILLEAIMNNRVRDALIVPVSIGYDKVIETSTYVNELLGRPKEKESLFQVINNFNILSLKLGRIDVRFAKPYSLREYIKSQYEFRDKEGCNSRPSGHFDPVRKPEDRSMLLQSFGYRVLSDINSVNVTMPTALVGTIILTLRGRGVGRNELIRKVNWLKGEILSRGGRVAHFGGMSTEQVVIRAVQNIRDLVGIRADLLEPVYYPLKRFELSFYRNQIIHLFINESLFALSVYSQIKTATLVGRQKCKLYPYLLDKVEFVSRLLKTEFVYGPGGLDTNFGLTISRLVKKGIFTLGEGNDTIQDEEPTPGSKTQWIKISNEEKRKGRETFDFYCFLVWPFVETYWLSCVSIFALMPSYVYREGPVNGKEEIDAPTDDELNNLEWIDEKTMMTRIQIFARTMYHEGDLNYFESINKETIKNALLRYVQMGVMLSVKNNTQPPSCVFNYIHREDIERYKDEFDLETSQTPVVPPAPTSPGTPALTTAPPPAKKSPLLVLTGKTTWYAVHPDWIPEQRLPSVNDEPAPIHVPAVVPGIPGHEDGLHGGSKSGAIYDTALRRSLMSKLLVPPEEYDDKSEPKSEHIKEPQLTATVYPLLPQDAKIKNNENLGPNGQQQGQKPHLQESKPNFSAEEVERAEEASERGVEQVDLLPNPADQPRPDLRPFSDLDTSNATDATYEAWSNVHPRGRLWKLCERIGKYRREGKNRRDTATVAHRVLKLAGIARAYNSKDDNKKKSKTKSSSSDDDDGDGNDDDSSGNASGSTGGSHGGSHSGGKTSRGSRASASAAASSEHSTPTVQVLNEMVQDYITNHDESINQRPGLWDDIQCNAHLNELHELDAEYSSMDEGDGITVDLLQDTLGCLAAKDPAEGLHAYKANISSTMPQSDELTSDWFDRMNELVMNPMGDGENTLGEAVTNGEMGLAEWIGAGASYEGSMDPTSLDTPFASRL